MLDRISVTSNGNAVAGHLKRLPDIYIRPAAHQAINATLRNSRVEFSRRVRARVSIKAQSIKKSLVATKATRQSLEGVITFRYSPISLKEYGGVRQGEKGVAITVLRGQRRTVRSSFVSEAMGGHVYRREGEKRTPTKGRYKGRRKKDGSPILRQPVVKLFGPTIVSQARAVLPGMQGWVNDRMVENTRQASNRYLDIARRRGR